MRGFDGYISVFKSMILGGDPGEFNAFINSFRAILINIIILPVSFVIAYSFYKKIRFRKFFPGSIFLAEYYFFGGSLHDGPAYVQFGFRADSFVY